jgi:hypothetical protein
LSLILERRLPLALRERLHGMHDLALFVSHETHVRRAGELDDGDACSADAKRVDLLPLQEASAGGKESPLRWSGFIARRDAHFCSNATE